MSPASATTPTLLHDLVDAGAEASRLDARGYGDTRPIEENTTPEGKRKNRRIEFVVVDRTR